MLFVYHGDNVQSRQRSVAKLRKELLKKRAQAEVFEIDADGFTPGRIEELTGSRGLFEEKYIVFLFHVLTTDEGEEIILSRAKQLKEAEHVFVLIEDDIKDNHLKQLKPHTKSIQEFSHNKKEEKEYKPFPLSDAYGQRNKKLAWIELQKGLAADQQPESLHGVLAWQTRLMLLAKSCDTAKQAGVSGYPFKKAKGFARNFSRSELEKKFQRLVRTYHEAHRGKFELSEALEQFLLEL